MPQYAIARHSKLKGSSVSASCHHAFRTKDTPNADHEKTADNRVIHGDTRPLREKVDERINLTDARTRSDNVECLEYLFTASHEFFFDERGTLNEENLDRWVELNMEFVHEECGPDLIGAVLHMDERTPHITAYRVPLKDGKLNCKFFYGTKEKNREFQTRYAEKMKVLGLERGIEKSRARHQDIKRFYGAINAPVKLKIRQHEITNPPRVFVTQAQQKDYKETVIKEVMDQLGPQLYTLRDKALMAEDEKRKRLAAEKHAAEKIAAAEKARDLADARRFLGEKKNQALQQENTELSRQNEQLNRALAGESQKVEQLSARVRDIPLTEVMGRLGCEGHLQPDRSTVYFSEDGRKALSIRDNHAYDFEDEPVAKNAIQLLLHVFNDHCGQNASPKDALRWIADNYGERQAVAAYLAEREEILTDYFAERKQSRSERDQKKERSFTAQEQERSDEQSRLETTKLETQIEEIALLIQ
ncbi:MAG: MobV family relaxase [Pyrinomonadaceae bacterium]